jgi:hypothetical protein
MYKYYNVIDCFENNILSADIRLRGYSKANLLIAIPFEL